LKAKALADIDMLFNLGKVYFYNCDFNKAEYYFELYKKTAKIKSSFDIGNIIEINNILTHISAEKLDTNKSLVLQNEVSSTLDNKIKKMYCAKCYFQMGLISFYQREFLDAKSNFEKSLKYATSVKNDSDQGYAHYGMALYFYKKNSETKTSDHLDKAQYFANKIDDKDLIITIHLLKGIVLTHRTEFDDGFREFVKAEQINSGHKNWYLNYHIKYQIALTTRKKGDLQKAKVLYNYLYQAINNTELNKLKFKVKKEIQQIGVPDYDLIIDVPNRNVTENNLGIIPFKNCFLLIDILLLLSKEPGKIFSKEDLANLIWNEEYKPLIHDNKIYYNINRLRRMIEPINKNIKYILTSKNGYLLSSSAQVQIITHH